MNEHQLEVADVLRTYGDDFLTRWSHVLSREQRKAFNDIRACRTASLGGHVDQCDQCGHCAISYNSCRNRSCPKCQAVARAKWLTEREAELLPVEQYFHVVFTLPQQIAVLALQNARRIYSILFQSVAETLLTIAADPKHLGAAIGFLAVLHSWGQNLHFHPHIHCVVPGGGISPDHSRWIDCRKSFFLPVEVLSCLFRKRFLIHLRKAFQRGKLQFHGELKPLAQPAAFDALCDQAGKIKWVVYAKPPFGGPGQVLKYLARYTHRVAISNRRLISLADGRVTFEWKDYADGNQIKTMTLEAVEFIRRFLLHVLPSGFVHLRHYGFLANRYRKEKLALCRSLLTARQSAPAISTTSSSGHDHEITAEAMWQRCPICKAGRMIVIQVLSAAVLVWLPEPLVVNTSSTQWPTRSRRLRPTRSTHQSHRRSLLGATVRGPWNPTSGPKTHNGSLNLRDRNHFGLSSAIPVYLIPAAFNASNPHRCRFRLSSMNSIGNARHQFSSVPTKYTGGHYR